MTRQDLEHIIRAAADVTQQQHLIIIGSQAILGQYPNAPEALLVSMEADRPVPGVDRKRHPQTATDDTRRRARGVTRRRVAKSGNGNILMNGRNRISIRASATPESKRQESWMPWPSSTP